MLNLEEPVHPARIARELLISEGFNLVERTKKAMLREPEIDLIFIEPVKINRIDSEIPIIENYLPIEFVHENIGINYFIAYKLAKLLPYTTMDFWLIKQSDYDAWHKWHDPVEIAKEKENQHRIWNDKPCDPEPPLGTNIKPIHIPSCSHDHINNLRREENNFIFKGRANDCVVSAINNINEIRGSNITDAINKLNEVIDLIWDIN